MKDTYRVAVETYAELGVDVEAALIQLESTPISMHCWQGDDVAGFENQDGGLGGGLAVTGNHPGKARNIDELRADLDKAFSLVPGSHRLNLHACYGDFGNAKVDRDAIEPAHFSSWIQWCKERGLGLDFNPTLFSHPLASDGYTLSHPDTAVRAFWIEHVRRCREIAATIGDELWTCVDNLWIPDGAKEPPIDRLAFRQRLLESLDAIFATEYSSEQTVDAVESKLFGIGSEAFVVGSHEFYMGYAQSRGLTVCLDMGHFHPTENVSDKVSSLALFFDHLLFHVSRGLRWDSDHVVLFTDEVRALMQEIVRSDVLDRAFLALDYFDASINRVAAWVLGMRSTQIALLEALLEPRLRLQEAHGFARLALQEEAKTMPLGVVWDEFCQRAGVPTRWTDEVAVYEREVLLARE